MHSSYNILQDLHIFASFLQDRHFFRNLARYSYPIISFKILSELLLKQDVLQEIHASCKILQVLARNKLSVV